jgi:hypothetical protein
MIQTAAVCGWLRSSPCVDGKNWHYSLSPTKVLRAWENTFSYSTTRRKVKEQFYIIFRDNTKIKLSKRFNAAACIFSYRRDNSQ